MGKFKWISNGGMQYLVDATGHRRGTVMPSKFGGYAVAKIGEGGRWVPGGRG